MPYYGHPMRFGTFITPINQSPEQPVLLAELSEQLGFDLVTFQDHPYQPSFLDTWTLLSWVAARTETIHVSGNVLNLPLRPPAVLARAAASLDLLSGGRFDLGLGAGGFTDAVAAMGGPHRTPGQLVESLSEAIDVIRGIWDTDNRAPLRQSGEHYSLAGAKRGPTPAHDIPIWIGALKPRMLRLIGRKGDGWLPSLAYLQPGDFAAGNLTIDTAAIGAGRDPREIRRLVNIGGRFTDRSGGFLVGPGDQWVEELLPYVVDDGVGTFILASDDPAVMQQFAAEVIPALREAVEREVGPQVDQRVRNSIALSKRRNGIDYDAVPATLAATAVEPGDSGYTAASATYLRGGSPALVLRPTNPDEVADALGFVRAHPAIEFGVRSGGHGISGRSTNDGGIVIDLGALNAIEVLSVDERRVRIGAGARWVDVAAALAPHGWALTSGDYGGVGVGGLATAGGVGWFAREHGLTIDHLEAVDVVLADGSPVRASATENADLFWAMRGAGANFGIATAFEFVVDEVAEIGFAQLAIEASDVAAFLTGWGAVVESAPRTLTSNLIIGAARPGQPVIAQVLAVVDSADPDSIIEQLQPFAELGPLVDQSVQLTTYSALMSNVAPGPHQGRGEPISRSGLVEHWDAMTADAAARLIASGAAHWFQIRTVGGAVSDVAPDATAYAHRSANFSVVVMGSNLASLDAAWSEFAPHYSGAYLSFDTRLGIVDDAFPPATLERLRELKVRYDPANLFRDNFNIEQAVAG
jgi:alkanesulfonate monooxygenase SsuD/methylene tetrahydromethanopterin reductase-like flavin-dependent oxidoreductase (luciferase family)/FAD/FMN-containing dehydrogenase